MFDTWILGVLSFGFLIASLADLKTKEVPDYLTGFLICLGLIVPIWSAISSGSILSPLAPSYLLGLLAFGFGYVMFKSSQWGGGDVKLITGSAMLMGQLEKGIGFFLGFFVNIFIAGSALGALYLILVAIKEQEEFIEKMKDVKTVFALSLIGSVVLISIPFAFDFQRTKWMFFMLAFLLIILEPLKILENIRLKTDRKVNELVPGDWVMEEVKKDDEVLYSPKNSPCVEEGDIKRLKRAGIEEVEVKEGMPFVPAFLIAFLLTWFFDNFLFNFILMGDLFYTPLYF